MNKASRPRRWPPLLTVLILLILSLTAWAVEQAREKGSPVSDPDYYQHGLTYNSGQEGPLAAQAGGWSIQVSIAGTLLEIHLTDATGGTVTGAKGEVVFLGSRPGAMNRLDLLLIEGDPGQYLVRLPEGLDGQVMAQLTLEKGAVSLHRSLLLNF